MTDFTPMRTLPAIQKFAFRNLGDTRPRGLVEVEKMLGRKVDEKFSRLEVLLETAVVGGGTRDYRIVAIR